MKELATTDGNVDLHVTKALHPYDLAEFRRELAE